MNKHQNTTATCAGLLVASVIEHQARLNQAAEDASSTSPALVYVQKLRQALRLLTQELIDLEAGERKVLIAQLAEKFPDTASSLETMWIPSCTRERGFR
jgi:hypothetical protein